VTWDVSVISPASDRSLLGWVDSYELSHDVTTETAALYRRAIGIVGRWAGADLTAGTISDDLVNRALVALIHGGRSPHYARSLKTAVAAVWRDMADAGLCAPPRRLRKIRTYPPQFTVWGPEEMRQLLDAATALPGRFRTLPLDRGSYFATMIRAAWDTALRRRDLHRLRRQDVSADWVDRQHKTGKPIRARLRDSTLQAIDALGRSPDDLLWPLWGSDEVFRATWNRIVRDAGLPHSPWKTLRKSAGTAAEIIQPGAGHLLLGNTRRVFERHYLAAGVVAPPQPPELS